MSRRTICKSSCNRGDIITSYLCHWSLAGLIRRFNGTRRERLNGGWLKNPYSGVDGTFLIIWQRNTKMTYNIPKLTSGGLL
jgi:hypothetical protein